MYVFVCTCACVRNHRDIKPFTTILLLPPTPKKNPNSFRVTEGITKIYIYVYEKSNKKTYKQHAEMSK